MISLLLRILVAFVDIYTILIFVRCLLTWLPNNTSAMQSISSVLGRICDPYLNLFRRIIPPIGGTIDISPIIALLALQLGMNIIYRIVALLI